MKRRTATPPDQPHPEHVLTEADIKEYCLEEAPADIGPSWEEIQSAAARRTSHETH